MAASGRVSAGTGSQALHSSALPSKIGSVFRNEAFQFALNAGHVKSPRGHKQRVERGIQTRGIPAGAQDHNFFVTRLEDVLTGGDQLFVQLLAGPKPREADLDVGRVLAREHDQVAGQVRDAHGLAHLQHEDLAPAPLGPAWTMSWAASGMVMK